jgi:hypothetical protein
MFALLMGKPVNQSCQDWLREAPGKSFLVLFFKKELLPFP